MYFLNFSKSKVIIFCVTFFMISPVISVEQTVTVIHHMLSNAGQIILTVSIDNNSVYDNTDNNALLNISVGSFNSNTDKNIKFQIMTGEDCLSGCSVTYNSGSKDHFLYSDVYCDKVGTIKLVYVLGDIQVFYQDVSIGKFHLPNFKVESIRSSSLYAKFNVGIDSYEKMNLQEATKQIAINIVDPQKENINNINAVETLEKDINIVENIEDININPPQ